MDKTPSAALALLLAACTPGAIAASNTDLSVTGIITPASCTPSLSDGGVVDHGKLTARDLELDKPTGSSAINPAHHGLGIINDDQKLGSVALGLFDPVADSQPVQAILSRDGGATWYPSSYLGHAGLTSFATPSDPYTPIALQELSARLRAFTMIVPATDLTLLDEVPIDGQATLQLKYW